MSVAYDPREYPLPGRVNFGWIAESWNFFMANAGVWIVATLALIGPSVLLGVGFYVYFLVSMFPSGFPPHAPAPGTPPAPPPIPPMLAPGNIGKTLALEFGVGLIFTVYAAYFYGALFRMAVRQVRGLPIEFADMFRGGPLFGRMLGAIFLLGLIGIGLELVAAIPTILLAALHPHGAAAIFISLIVFYIVIIILFLVLWSLLLPAFALMADGMGVVAALRRSVGAMKAHWLPTTGFVFVLILLVYASEIPCGLGLLATIPMIFLICALAYRDLVGMPNMVPPPQVGYDPRTPGVWPPPPGSGPLPPGSQI